ncbi:SpaA isopeptide-forming pilin-related protein [Solobacterium moorei]|uniref:Cna protein B-type domain protein n=2 Tax=Solobacterium moorei TaxID=102148 RepID=E7ML11_9FIRM|nr:SpaA isopeptide-forming pilin-related protein [Solobacterium moorei]EFW25436.1 Cna protein B-type domain protein [Solobacterium moorei F0204]
MNLQNKIKKKAVKLFSVLMAFLMALAVFPMHLVTTPVDASTVSVDTLEVGDTFSGTLGTSNTDASIGHHTFDIDYIDGLLGSVSNQIVNQLAVYCEEPGHIGLTYKTAYEPGDKTYYPYNATVTDVQPDGRVTLRIDVPRYLNPYTGEEATGFNYDTGTTVPYQRCGATWVIQTAPRNITVNVTLDKANGNPTMTQGNAACYAQDLSGAVYGVYSDAALTNEVGRITTDANGHGELNGITVQRNAVLYTKELVAPRGFNLDSQVYRHAFTTNGETYNVQSTDQPLNDPLRITLNKVSADGNVVTNPASLEGAEFTIKYYAGQYTFDTLPATTTRTWVLKTTKNARNQYFTTLDENHFVSGDAFYLDGGAPTLPLGTITVEETKAPAGYTLENKTLTANGQPTANVKDGKVLFNIVDENSTAAVVGGNEYTVVEGVLRGGLEIQKKDADTNENVGTATFQIVNKNNYDVVARDENGDVVATAAAGQTLPYTITTDANGYWKSNDAFLPAGDYELVEVSAPAGYYLNKTAKPFEIKDNGAIVSLDYADDKIVIDVAKTDGKGNNVAGAKMTLIDKVTGNEIVTFTSTKENTDISKFVEGGKTYILREDEAPFGFNKFEDIEFTVTGTRQHEQVVKAVDTRKVFYVSAIKVDAMDSSKKLKGAELTLFKADGTVAVDKDGNPCVGITDGEGVITWAVEFADDLGGYYVQETAAPEGYRINNEHFQVVLSEDYDFAINNAVKVVVNDMALPSVKTGDTFNAALFACMLIGSLGAAVFLFLKKKELVK